MEYYIVLCSEDSGGETLVPCVVKTLAPVLSTFKLQYSHSINYIKSVLLKLKYLLHSSLIIYTYVQYETYDCWVHLVARMF